MAAEVASTVAEQHTPVKGVESLRKWPDWKGPAIFL